RWRPVAHQRPLGRAEPRGARALLPLRRGGVDAGGVARASRRGAGAGPVRRGRGAVRAAAGRPGTSPLRGRAGAGGAAAGGGGRGAGVGAPPLPEAPACPVIMRQPSALTGGSEGQIALNVNVYGVGPLTYQWERDGVDLLDGPAPGGGQIVGAATEQLSIVPA